MAGKIISMDIGYTSTKLCLADYRAKNPRVYKYVTIATPPDTIRDGELNVTETFVDEIRNAMAKKRMQAKQVVFTVNSAKIASREVVIPYVKEDRVEALVKANASDYFPIDLGQYEMGHIVLGPVDDGSAAKKLKLLVLAAPQSLIEGYRKLADLCGMRLAAIDYSGNSIYQMVKNDCAEGVQMVVKVDERNTIITVLKDKAIVLQRSIAYGVDAAVQTIADSRAFSVNDYHEALELAVRKTCMRLSLDQKEMLLEPEEDEEDNIALLNAKQTVTDSLGMLVNGIGRVMDYYSSRSAGERVDKIHLTGLGGDFSGLSKLMTNELGVRVRVMNHLNSFNIERNFKGGRFGEYIACVGAAAAPVGFIPDDKGQKKLSVAPKKGNDLAAPAYLLCGGGILIAIALLAVSVLTLLEQQNQYAENVMRLNGLTEIRELYAKYSATLTAHADIANLYACTESQNEHLLDFMAEMEEKLPYNIKVIAFSAGTESVTLTAEVKNKEEMANTIQEFRAFDSIAAVNLQGAKDEEDEEDGIRKVTFTLVCTYKTPEERAGEETE